MEPIKVVEDALTLASARLAKIPNFTLYQSIHAQLTYLLSVLNGTESNRSRLKEINFGVYAAKEFDASDPEFAKALSLAFWVATQLSKGLKVESVLV